MTNVLNIMQLEDAGLLSYLDAFFKELDIKPVTIDIQDINTVIRSINNDFPSNQSKQDIDKYKQAALFVLMFINIAPIKSKFPKNIFPDLYYVKNHENIIPALSIAMQILGKKNIFDSPLINMLIEALSGATPSMHFKLLTVCFMCMYADDTQKP